MMSYRFILLLTLALVLAAAAFAQPAPTDAWLNVSVVNADGTPFIYTPQINLTTHTPGVIITRRPIADGDKTILFAGLKPGDYEIEITVAAASISLPRRSLKIVAGANNYAWKLADPIIATGEFTLDGKQPVAVKTVQAYLVNTTTKTTKAGTSTTYTPLSGVSVTDEGKYTFTTQSVGLFNVVFLTEKGYSETTKIDIPADTEKTFAVPLATLLPGGTLKFTVTNAATGAALPGASVRLIYYSKVPAVTNPALTRTIKYTYVPTISLALVTDDNGVLITPALPEGRWRYQITALPLKATARVKATKKLAQNALTEVKVGVTTEIAVAL